MLAYHELLAPYTCMLFIGHVTLEAISLQALRLTSCIVVQLSSEVTLQGSASLTESLKGNSYSLQCVNRTLSVSLFEIDPLSVYCRSCYTSS